MSRFPWWGSVVLAIIGYLGCKYGPLYLLDPQHRLSDLLPQFAPVVAMGFLLLAAKQLYDHPDEQGENDVAHDDSGKETPRGDEDPDSRG